MDNRIFQIPDWSNVGTVSSPSASFNKIYPKSDGFWYNMSSTGVEKQLSHSFQIGSGLVSSGPTISSYGSLLSINVDSQSGLTTSGGVLRITSITSSNLNTDGNGGATAGYVLSVDASGFFKWVKRLSFTGSTNFVSKFTSSSDISNSQIYDDGTFVGINSTTSSVVGTRLEVSGDITINGGNRLNFDSVTSIKEVSNRIVIDSPTGLLVKSGIITYLDSVLDGINGNTFQILNSFVTFTARGLTNSGAKIIIPDLSYFGIGTSSPSNLVHIFATQSGIFRLQDTTEGLNKVLVSDVNGVGTWLPLSGLTVSASSIILGSQSGLTVSSGELSISPTIAGYGLSFSNGILFTINRYHTVMTLTASTITTITHGLGLTYAIIQLLDTSTGDLVIGNYSSQTSNSVNISLSETTTVDITIKT